MHKKNLLIVLLLLLPTTAFAVSVPWNRPATGIINPLFPTDSVGIGTSTPTASLHVASSTNSKAKSQIKVEDTSAALGANVRQVGLMSDTGTLKMQSITDAGVESTLGTFATSTIAQVLVGTTTAFNADTVATFTKGASATTTVNIGEIGLTSSKSCVNMNRTDGGAGSFFISAAGALVVETTYCK